MTKGARVVAAAIYIFGAPVAGMVLGILLVRRRSNSELFYHGFRVLGMTVMALGGICFWLLVLYIISWVPYVGFPLGIGIFAPILAFVIFEIIAGYVAAILILANRTFKLPFIEGIIVGALGHLTRHKKKEQL